MHPKNGLRPSVTRQISQKWDGCFYIGAEDKLRREEGIVSIEFKKNFVIYYEKHKFCKEFKNYYYINWPLFAKHSLKLKDLILIPGILEYNFNKFKMTPKAKIRKKFSKSNHPYSWQLDPGCCFVQCEQGQLENICMYVHYRIYVWAKANEIISSVT